MSGLSLAVAPGSDPNKPSMSISNNTKDKPLHTSSTIRSQSTGIMGSLRVIELQLVAFIMVFSLSGLVPLLDLLFPAFVLAYIIALSLFAFPTIASNATSSEPELFQGGKLFGLYVIVGTTVGLLLPLAYVLGGFARGDEQAVRSATPHLFFLSFQILTENIISGMSSLFSPPVRALVPLLYTVRRIFILLDWIQHNTIDSESVALASIKQVAWYWFGRSLAVVNLAYFSINLLCFLIPCFLPRAFQRYFNEIRDHEMQTKIVHDDKRFSSTSASASVDDNNKKDD